MIKNTFPNKSGNPEHLKKYSEQLESSTTNIHKIIKDLLRAFYKLFSLQFCVSNDQWKKYCVVKILQGICKTFLCENNRNYNSCKFSSKFTFILFVLSRNQNQESNFHQVGDLVTRNICFFVYSKLHSTSKVGQI